MIVVVPLSDSEGTVQRLGGSCHPGNDRPSIPVPISPKTHRIRDPPAGYVLADRIAHAVIPPMSGQSQSVRSKRLKSPPILDRLPTDREPRPESSALFVAGG